MSITQPRRFRMAARMVRISGSTCGQPPGDQRLVRQPQLRPPVDRQVRVLVHQTGAGQVAVQHHHHVTERRAVLLDQPPAGGQVHRLPDPVEHDPVPGGQQLHAADPRDHGQLQLHAVAGDRLDDPDGAVVERRVAPGQEPDRPAGRQRRPDHLGVRRGAGRVPVQYPGLVARRRLPLRVGHFDDPVAIVLDHRLTEGGAQRDQVVLRAALVGDQEHVDRVQRGDRLAGQVLRLAAADPDDQDPDRLRQGGRPP